MPRTQQASLNPQQQAAAEAGDGPLAIVAGPGTGKTKTLVARIMYLIQSGKAKPQHILALTFTKKAAEEMRQRVADTLGPSKTQPNIMTFHALCHELLGGKLQFVPDAQRLLVIRRLRKAASLKGMSARELGLMISRAKNSPDTIDAPTAKIVEAYNQALAELGVSDFDDLLLGCYQLLQANDALRARVQSRYRYILVDEFQDTNGLQYALLQLLREHDNVFVIGDPNQSIYGFRGAHGGIFAQFRADFPACKQVALTTNYRSVPQVVQLSNAIFGDDATLTPHTQQPGQVRAVEVLDEYSEAAWVLGEIQAAIGGGDMLQASSDDLRANQCGLRDIAVLYRSRGAAKIVQTVLCESGLPVQVVGDGSPYDRPEQQAIITLLRAAHTGESVDLEGFTGAERQHLANMLGQADHQPAALAERIIKTLGFEPSPELQQLVGSLVRFTDLAAAVRHFDHIAEHGFYDPEADAITLLTIHASKGLEFPVVFLIAAEEGILPSGRASDKGEERRLFYVAATRARQRLEITHAQKRGAQPAAPSSFIQAVPPDVLPRHVDPDIQNQLRRQAKRTAKRSQQRLF